MAVAAMASSNTKNKGKSYCAGILGQKVKFSLIFSGFTWGTRHTVALLAFIGYANVFTVRVNLSVAIVAMVAPGRNGNPRFPEIAKFIVKLNILLMDCNYDPKWSNP